MKWTYTPNSPSTVNEFRLSENGSSLAMLKYNTHQHVIRITSDDKHEVFFLEKNDTVTDQYDLTNAYGQSLGILLFDESMDFRNGYVILNGSKYFFAFPENDSDELQLFTNDRFVPLLSVDIQNTKDFYESKDLNTVRFHAILVFGLCWYSENHSIETTVMAGTMEPVNA